MPIKPHPLSLAVLLAMASMAAAAQDDAMLQTTEVTAPKLIVPTRQANETVYTGTAVTSEGIERQGRKAETSVHNAIDMLPGVNTESPDATGLTAETSNMRVRGMRSSGGTLSVEGIPNWGGNPIGARDYIYDLQNFNDVSVYKGATPGDIGSGVGTRGGSIVLRPKWPGERFAGSVGLSVGSDRYRRLFARIESGKLNASGTAIAAAASYSKSDKWRGPGELGPRMNANFTLSQPLGDTMDLKLWLNHNKLDQHLYRAMTYAQTRDLAANYKLDFNPSLTGSAAQDYLYYGYNRGTYRNDDALAIFTWRPSASATITLKPYYAKEDTQIYQGGPQQGGRVQLRNRDIIRKGVVSEIAADFGPVQGVLGYHWESSDSNISSSNYRITAGGLVYNGVGIYGTSGTSYTRSPYLKLSGKAGQLNWQAGLKHFSFAEAASDGYMTGPAPLFAPIRTPDYDRKAKTYSIWLPSLGLAYDLTPQTQLQASAGRNFLRPYSYMPLINTYNNNRPAFVAGGVTLQDMFDGYGIEKSSSFDLGMRYQGEHFDLTPTLFYGKHKGLLTTIADSRVMVGTPSKPVQYQQNVGKATSYGLEMAFNAYVNDRLSIFVNPTYTHFTYDADITGAPGSKGRQVVDTPRFMARTGLSYRWGNFEINPSIRYLGPRFGDAAHTERIGSHVVADLALNYTRKKALGNATLKAGLELNNLFNRKYVAVVNASDDNQGGAASYMAGAPFGAALKVGLEW